jgi:MFS family permease
VIVQRMPLRGIQVGADLVRALAVVSIPLAWWAGLLSVAQLVVVALVMSFANVLFAVANQTFLPEIVPAAQLQARNSLNSGTHAATELGGPSLGGLAVQVLGAAPTLLVDAVSYLISAVLLRTLPARQVPAPATRTSMLAQIREGWHFVTRHPVMAPGMWAATVVNFVNGAYHALFAFYLVRELHASPALVGLLLAADGLGTLIGAAVTTRYTDRFGTARGMIFAAFAGVAGALLIPAGGVLAFAAGNLIFAGTVVVLSVTTRTYRMIASPPELLSRVIATVRFVSWGAIPVGGLIAGALAGQLGARTTLLIFGAVTVCTPLIWLLSPVRGLRDLPMLDAPEAATAAR